MLTPNFCSRLDEALASPPVNRHDINDAITMDPYAGWPTVTSAEAATEAPKVATSEGDRSYLAMIHAGLAATDAYLASNGASDLPEQDPGYQSAKTVWDGVYDDGQTSQYF